MNKINITEETKDSTLNIALDTIKQGKQALVFVSTKSSAESCAEKIALKVKNVKLEELSEKIKNSLARPTKQCERLSRCIIKGIAFHHAGLASKQRELIEDNFRNGTIKIICATPTLAMGIDMPAFRTVIRDLKRYGGRWGMEWIQVLEYHQMAGRAGRPGHGEWGEAICIAQTEEEKEHIIKNFINGSPEPIFSKLAVEPVLRTYVLSLISTGLIRNRKELSEFFSKTFWAHQYKDQQKLETILDKMITLLTEWGFLTGKNDFQNATINKTLEATKIGQRVAELYIDPLTADFIINCLKRAEQKKITEFSYLNMIASTLEIRPQFRVSTKEHTLIEEKISEKHDEFLYPQPSIYDMDYEYFLNSVKTTIIFEEWIEETDEHDLLEKYNARPGEFSTKRNIADWLLKSSIEFSTLLGFHELIKDIRKTQVRLEYGVKEELLALIKLKNIGRVRARILFRNGIKTLGDIKKIDITTLTQLIGPALAIDVKKQVGEEIEEVKTGKRKGQKSVEDY